MVGDELKADDAEPKPALDEKTDAQSSEGITQSWESAQEIKAEGNAHFKAGCPAEALQVFSLSSQCSHSLHSALTLFTVALLTATCSGCHHSQYTALTTSLSLCSHSIASK